MPLPITSAYINENNRTQLIIYLVAKYTSTSSSHKLNILRNWKDQHKKMSTALETLHMFRKSLPFRVPLRVVSSMPQEK